MHEILVLPEHRLPLSTGPYPLGIDHYPLSIDPYLLGPRPYRLGIGSRSLPPYHAKHNRAVPHFNKYLSRAQWRLTPIPQTLALWADARMPCRKAGRDMKICTERNDYKVNKPPIQPYGDWNN